MFACGNYLLNAMVKLHAYFALHLFWRQNIFGQCKKLSIFLHGWMTSFNQCRPLSLILARQRFAQSPMNYLVLPMFSMFLQEMKLASLQDCFNEILQTLAFIWYCGAINCSPCSHKEKYKCKCINVFFCEISLQWRFSNPSYFIFHIRKLEQI